MNYSYLEKLDQIR